MTNKLGCSLFVKFSRCEWKCKSWSTIIPNLTNLSYQLLLQTIVSPISLYLSYHCFYLNCCFLYTISQLWVYWHNYSNKSLWKYCVSNFKKCKNSNYRTYILCMHLVHIEIKKFKLIYLAYLIKIINLIVKKFTFFVQIHISCLMLFRKVVSRCSFRSSLGEPWHNGWLHTCWSAIWSGPELGSAHLVQCKCKSFVVVKKCYFKYNCV